MDLKRFAIGGATRPDALSGFQPEFSMALAQFFAAAPPEVQAQMRIGSGYRSPQRQAELYKAALAKYGNEREARRWVAPPGKSQHNHGHAADLKYLNPAATKWAHENAGRFGLAFPLSNENWHIELAGTRGKHPAHALPVMAQAGQPAPQAARGFVQNPPMPAGAVGTTPATVTAAGPNEAPVEGLGGTLADAFVNFAPTFGGAPQPTADAQAAERVRRQALFGEGGLVASMFA